MTTDNKDISNLSSDIEIINVDTTEIKVGELTTDEARQLTATIRNAAQMLWVLIVRAHQGKAWKALGYKTWENYVKTEFDMSRSRSYQILDQARVISAIEAAVPEGTKVSLTEAVARDLKDVLDEVLPKIEERTQGLDPDEAEEILNTIVEEQRVTLENQPKNSVSKDDNFDNDDFFDEETKENNKSQNDNPNFDDNFDEDDFFDEFETEEDKDLNQFNVSEEDIDMGKIRATVNAAHDIYSSLISLASLPEDLEAVVKVIPAERDHKINETLQHAVSKLSKFVEIWEDNGRSAEE